MTSFSRKKPGLAELLEAAIASPQDGEAPKGYDIARTSCRIPRAVLVELAAMAQANGMSVSLLVNLLLDSYLTGQGRPGYVDLAPWYPDYALRRKAEAE